MNFYSTSKNMSGERGTGIGLKPGDVLLRMRRSRMFRIVKNAEVRECLAGEGRQGMNTIGQDRKNTAPAYVGPLECAVRSSVYPGRKDVESDIGDFMARLTNYSKALLVPAVLLCFFIFGSASTSLASTPAAAVPSLHAATNNDVVKMKVKVLSVLESRTMDRTILNKAADKLSTMEGSRLRLLSSLCDRISEDSDAAGADIAFSLMTVLIVLS